MVIYPAGVYKNTYYGTVMLTKAVDTEHSHNLVWSNKLGPYNYDELTGDFGLSLDAYTKVAEPKMTLAQKQSLHSSILKQHDTMKNILAVMHSLEENCDYLHKLFFKVR